MPINPPYVEWRMRLDFDDFEVVWEGLVNGEWIVLSQSPDLAQISKGYAYTNDELPGDGELTLSGTQGMSPFAASSIVFLPAVGGSGTWNLVGFAGNYPEGFPQGTYLPGQGDAPWHFTIEVSGQRIPQSNGAPANDPMMIVSPDTGAGGGGSRQ